METKNITTNILIYRFDELSPEYQDLIEKAKEQTKKAYAPYSHFNVGSAVLLANKKIICGNNQENIAYPSGLCAERVSVFYANSQYPEIPIKAIAIAAHTKEEFTDFPINPCGACLQVLLEIENKQKENIILILYGKKEIHIIKSIKECLPLIFSI